LTMIQATASLNASLLWVYRLCPGFCLGHGLFTIASQSFVQEAAAQAGMSVSMLDALWAWDMVGKDLLYLFVQAPVYFVLAIVIDTLLQYPAIAGRLSNDPEVADEPVYDDIDVVAEAARVQATPRPNDVVVLKSLRKVYQAKSSVKVAVRDLSFGLRKGECFGFLGINGAGKTSTLNCLTGAILPSSGEAWLAGKHILTEQSEVRRLIGYCPQHDALLDLLTVREHLQLFGRLKGVAAGPTLAAMVSALIETLDLSSHAHKLACTLSGGNKRKLSVGIALIGSPPLVFLDEPSTGVDPAARRFMWSVIETLSTQRKECTVILTTHVMEEAEALCGKIGVMVGGRLRCIGSGQHLKSRFGHGYQLELKLATPTLEQLAKLQRGLSVSLPAEINAADVASVCASLGMPGRAVAVCDAGEGHMIHHAMVSTGSCPVELFCEWWLQENAVASASEFVRGNFAGSALLERHDVALRYNLAADTSLAEVFATLELAKERGLCVQEYGVCQTSLEQIFNEFASQQQEEQGAVRGIVCNGGMSESQTAALQSFPVFSASARGVSQDGPLKHEVSVQA
jgi:ATP-binding cassette, subfamily A (ABC1), member 3